MTQMPRSNLPGEIPRNRSSGLLIFSWFFVGIPLVWGVIQTVIKSMALFH
jgi:hypothetical protein